MNLLTLLSEPSPLSSSFCWRFNEVLKSSYRISHADDTGHGDCGSGHGGSHGHGSRLMVAVVVMVMVVVLIRHDLW